MARQFNESFRIGQALEHGLAALKAAPGPLLAGAVLVQCTDGSGGGGNSLASPGRGGEGGSFDTDAFAAAFRQSADALSDFVSTTGMLILGIVAVMVIAIAICVFLFHCWVLAGYLRVQRDILDRGEGRYEVLFGAGGRLWSMVGWKLLEAMILLGTGLAAAAPGLLLMAAGTWGGLPQILFQAGVLIALVLAVPVLIYVGLGLSFGEMAVALEDRGPLEALDRTWTLVRGHRISLFVFQFVLAIFTAIGVCACCVGIFVTRGIADSGRTGAYLLYTRDDEQNDRMWVLSPPGGGSKAT